MLPPTFPTALTYILAHPDAALLPFIPEAVSLIPPISNGLSNLITTTTPVADIMATMKAQEDAIMEARRVSKAVPVELADRHSAAQLARPVNDRASDQRQAPASTRGPVPLWRVLDRHFLVAVAWPSLLIMLGITAIPFVLTLGLAFTNYDLVRPRLAVHRPRQLRATCWPIPNMPPVVFNTIYLVLATTIIDTPIGLGLAVLMESRFRGRRHHSSALPAADHDRADHRRHDLAGDVQQ